jgi:hypothetical protein
MSTVGVEEPARGGLQRWMARAGWVVSLAPLAIVLASARWKLTYDPWYVKEWARIGWYLPAMKWLALTQLTAMALYLIPQTALLGVVLLTGYLGGAIATYVRIGEFQPPLVPLGTALLAWLGLWLRDARLRTLLPIRRRESE